VYTNSDAQIVILFMGDKLKGN